MIHDGYTKTMVTIPEPPVTILKSIIVEYKGDELSVSQLDCYYVLLPVTTIVDTCSNR